MLVNYPAIKVNDLDGLTKPYLKEWAQEPGNVHYKELGYTNQGKEVAQVIINNLKK